MENSEHPHSERQTKETQALTKDQAVLLRAIIRYGLMGEAVNSKMVLEYFQASDIDALIQTGLIVEHKGFYISAAALETAKEKSANATANTAEHTSAVTTGISAREREQISNTLPPECRI